MALRLKRRSNRRRRSSGGAILETVLVMPLLVLLGFGMVEFGYFFYIKHCLEGAARDGCRAFIASGATLSDVQTAVDNSMRAAGLQNSGYQIYVGDGTPPAPPSKPPQVTTANQASCAAGDTISVYVSCTWGTVGQGFRLLGSWDPLPSTRSVVGQAVMQKEG